MRLRSILGVVVGLALIVAPATGAMAKAKAKPKPKVYCNLLTDQANDGNWFVPGVSSAGLDILGGDVATGAKTMVAVLRLRGTNFTPTGDPWSNLGYSWRIGVQSSLGQTYVFNASLHFGGTVTGSATVAGAGVPVTFAVDTAKNTFTWTLKRSDAKNLARPKNVFHGFYANSYVESSSADSTAPTAPSNTYPDRGLSCLKPA